MNRGMKFWIGDDPELSERVQWALFAAGYKWVSNGKTTQHTSSQCLTAVDGFVYIGGGRAFYDRSERENINIDWMRTIPESAEPVELFGKKYDEKVLKERLADCPTIEE